LLSPLFQDRSPYANFESHHSLWTSAIVVAPFTIIAVVSTILVLLVSSKCSWGIAVLPLKSMLKGNAYPRNQEMKTSKIKARVQHVMCWKVALRIDRNPQFA
jgi:hypothetical protein